jgi:L,D-transpeptidase catalytic domain/Putative peptidoglycan binding domain
MNDPRHPSNPIAKWLPAIAAAGLLGTVVVAGVALGGSGGDNGQSNRTLADSAFTTANDEVPVSTFAVPDSVPEVIATIETTAPVVKIPLKRTLVKGLAGEDVRRVQARLTELGFVPGPSDGIYGDETIKSVWAYEKLVLKVESDSPTGKVTPEMWADLQEPFVIQPRRPHATPNHTEVYLPEQVLAVFHNDKPVMITHMSSGSNEEWCEEVTISPGEYGNRDGEEPIVRGECGISNTPGGVFSFNRQIVGLRQSSLGGMWNPSYFNYGIAIHGALNVPLQGASHGCIRIPLNISEDLQGLLSNGDQVFVWDGIKEPEANGSPPPTFNWLDPNYEGTTTTSSTTLPETTTTVPPTTIAAPETTTPPATTTTVPTTTTTTTTVAPEPTTTTTEPAGGTDGGTTDD